MLVNTPTGIVEWLKKNNGALTFHFRNSRTDYSEWTIYIQEDYTEFLYEIAKIHENKFSICNRKVIFDGYVSRFKECEDDLYLKKTVGAVREKDLEKFIKFYTNKISWAKKLYKEKLIKNICKETFDD